MQPESANGYRPTLARVLEGRSAAPDPGAFLHAAAAGDLPVVHAELRGGVDVDADDRRGRTAVLLAAQGGHLDVVRALVDAGADIDRQDSTCLNPFLFGCIAGDLELVRLMVSAGADIERVTRFGGNGITPASEKGHLEVVRELLTTTDINVNHTNFVGWTPLIEAIILNDGGPRQVAIVELLLAHGADPELTDKYGVAPIELARRKGYQDIAALLDRVSA